MCTDVVYTLLTVYTVRCIIHTRTDNHSYKQTNTPRKVCCQREDVEYVVYVCMDKQKVLHNCCMEAVCTGMKLRGVRGIRFPKQTTKLICSLAFVLQLGFLGWLGVLRGGSPS